MGIVGACSRLLPYPVSSASCGDGYHLGNVDLLRPSVYIQPNAGMAELVDAVVLGTTE